jgi:hypothetical protein
MIFYQNVSEESVLSVEEYSNAGHLSNISHDRGVRNSSWLHYEDRSKL